MNVLKKLIFLLMTVLLSMCLLSCIHICTSFDTQKVEPTCTGDGYTILTCRDCGRYKYGGYVKRKGHTEIIRKYAYQPTCTEQGATDEIICSECWEVIQEQTIIEAIGHQPVVVSPGRPATCTAAGVADLIICAECEEELQAAVEIPIKDHDDENGDYYCDACDLFFADYGEPISTVDDLKAINTNMNGCYKLTADISLAGIDWIPIGTKENPFRGYFYGNGYRISGLNTQNKEISGIFGYNAGTIDSLTVNDFSFSVYNTDTTLGCVAAFNSGKIINCEVGGTVLIFNEVYYNYVSNRSIGTKSKKSVIGGICAENNGLVENSNVTASIKCSSLNTSIYKFEKPAFYITTNENLTVDSSVYCGGIVGINNGNIKNCSTSSNSTSQISAVAEKKGTYGDSYANSYVYYASLVGYNAGEILNCFGIKFGAVVTEKESGGGVCKTNVYEDNTYTGLVGYNNGKIEGVYYE